MSASPQQVALNWQKRQAQILTSTYVQAWHAGAQSYRAQYATPTGPAGTPRKPQPAAPSPQLMGRALAPAMNSLANMARGLGAVAPTAAAIAAAGGLAAALQAAMVAYLTENAWRLAGGVSAAWAGEQHGYAQAADADGLLIAWDLGGSNPCPDCVVLSGFPPMPLDMWPTLPGEGDTECSVGCRCSIRTAGAVSPTQEPVVLTPAQIATATAVQARQRQLVFA